MLTIVRRELKNQLGSWLVWTGSISVLLAVCIFVYPQMQEEARGLGDAFSSMGAFTKAFGMDSLDFGSWPGFYALECGNVLGIGGAFYAALCGSQILSRETKGHTAEFLFSQPVTRTQVYLGKLLAVILEIVALNLVAAAVSLLCQQMIQETMPARAFWLLHTGYAGNRCHLPGPVCVSSCRRNRGWTGTCLSVLHTERDLQYCGCHPVSEMGDAVCL